jgi:hypothetical protein
MVISQQVPVKQVYRYVCLLLRRTLSSRLECVDILFGDFVMLVSCIECGYLVRVTDRSVILNLRERLVHAVAERVLPEMSVILWIGEIFLIPKGNNKNIILIKGRGN